MALTQNAEEKLEILFNDHAYFLTVNIIAPIDFVLNIFGFFVIAFNPSREIGAYKWYLLNLQVSSSLCSAV